MKLTIIVSDNAVYQDGKSFSDLDLSFIPNDIHALQWNGAHGWIEFADDENNQKKSNQDITELPDWVSNAITKWNEAKALEDLIVAEQPPTI